VNQFGTSLKKHSFFPNTWRTWESTLYQTISATIDRGRTPPN